MKSANFLRLWRVALAAALGLGSSYVARADQTRLYEWREPGGAVSYSQSPPARGTKYAVREVDTQTFTPAQKLAIKSQLAGEQAATQAEAAYYRQRIATADAGVSSALSTLTSAERALRLGRAPGPGERRGNAGGGTRLLASFFERQRRLDEAVQHAREQLAAADQARGNIQP